MELGDFSKKRRGTDEIQLADDDYFCWRWCKRQFASELAVGNIPSNEQILQSLLSNSHFYRFRIDHLQIRDNSGDSRFADEVFQVYGDDPLKLASIWEWSKASGILSKWAGSSTHLPKHHLSSRVLHDQIKNDRMSLSIPQFSEVVLSASLSTFLTNQYFRFMNEMITERLDVLGMLDNLDCDVSFLKTTGTTTGSPENFRNISIACSVAGSGKTQHMFNQLYERHGHYIVSGRVPRHTSPDYLLAARQGKASMDTSFLCDLLGQSLDTDLYRECLRILIENRQRTLRLARAIYSELKHGDLEPSQWLLFQTVCNPHFDPFLETFKLALLCHWSSSREDASIEPLGDTELFCFDEVQCEMSSEPVESDEPQPLDTFLYIIARMKLGDYAHLGLLLSGTSLQVDECLRRAKNAGLEYVTFGPTSASPRQWQRVTNEIDIFDRFNTLSNYEEFHHLVHDRVKRIIDQAYYLDNLDSEFVERYQLWETFMPDDSFLSKKKIFQILKSLLSCSKDRLVSVFVGIIGCCSEMSPERSRVNDLLKRTSALFRGRFRWSVILIERIFIEVLRQMDILFEEKTTLHRLPNSLGKYYWMSYEDLIEIAEYLRRSVEVIITDESQRAHLMIKEQLQYRIRTLQHKGHHYLLEDLFATAVRADLMHQPCIFRNLESAKMVTNGFALLLNSTAEAHELRRELAEPLAVDAIIEYLRGSESETKHRYEEYLRELLYHTQDDDSAFGKVTEFYIAWAFGGLLRHAGSVLQISPVRSYDLLSALGNADLISRVRKPRPASPEKLGPLERFSLVQSASRAVDGVALGRKIEFHQWLQNVRQGGFFPTFYFPSNAAGPDIVFCLQNQEDRTKRILCALQVKTGTTKVTGGDSFHLVRTLDPNLWFEGTYQNQREHLLEELRAHGPDLQILTMLVVTSLEVKDFFASRENLRDGLAQLQDPVCKYSTALEEAAGDVDRQNAQAQYKIAERNVERIINKFQNRLKTADKQRIVQDARAVVQVKRPNSTATRDATIIRQALTFSHSFHATLIHEMNNTGLLDQSAGSAISQFLDAYNLREEMKIDRLQKANNVKIALEQSAMSISSGNTPNNQNASAESLSCPRVLDFFFIVLERSDLNYILGAAFNELVGAMKWVEQRKNMEAANTDEDEMR